MPRALHFAPIMLALSAALFSMPAAAATYTVYFTINAAQEVPTNTSCGTAFGMVTVNTVANTLTFDIQRTAALTGTETAAHIHGPAAPGFNAAVKFTLPAGFPKSGTWTYLEADEASITSGLMYVNIHSSFKSGGEIRGQIPAMPGSVTRDQAAGVVIHDVILPSSNQPDLGAYGPMSFVPSGGIIRDRAVDGPVIVTASEDAWYFWIDDRQDQHFGHKVRHVLVSATTGAVLSVTSGNFWPVVNGVALYETLAEREATADRIWPLSTGNPACLVTEPQNGVEPAPGREFPMPDRLIPDRAGAPSLVAAASTWAFVGSGVDTAKDRNCKADFDSMRTWFGAGNPQGPQIPAAGIGTIVNPTKAQLCTAMEAMPMNCDKFYFYWTGHGDPADGSLILNGGKITPAELISKIKKLGPKEVCITIDACFSGFFMTVFGDSGLTGSCSSAADPQTPGLFYKKKAFGTGSIYTQARLSCLRTGLRGPALEAWARDSVAKYMTRRNAACPMNPLPYPNPQYVEGKRFDGPGVMPFTAGGDSCKTVCIRFPGDPASHTCANSTLYCETNNPPPPQSRCVRSWNWNTGSTRYFNATTDPGATGNYNLTVHSNGYPVEVTIQWLGTVGPDTPSSVVNFPAWSLGFPDGNFEFGVLPGPSQSINLQDGLLLHDVPGTLGNAGTQVILINQNLLGDPSRPFMHVGGDPSQPFSAPAQLTLGATALMDAGGFPVTGLPVDVQVQINGSPHAHQVGNFVTTGSASAVPSISAVIPIPPLRPGFVQITLMIPGSAGTATLDYMRLDFEGPPTLGVDPEPVARGVLRLLTPWPNPTFGLSRIRFELPRPARALVRVYDVTGRLVHTVANESFTAGVHTLGWNGMLANGNPAAGGVYYVALDVEGRRLTSRFVRMR